jgi:hypothetical protein
MSICKDRSRKRDETDGNGEGRRTGRSRINDGKSKK